MTEEIDYIPLFSKEANKLGEQRICGKIYKKDIQENGNIKMFCYAIGNGKVWYTSSQQEYNEAIKQKS